MYTFRYLLFPSRAEYSFPKVATRDNNNGVVYNATVCLRANICVYELYHANDSCSVTLLRNVELLRNAEQLGTGATSASVTMEDRHY